jgi:predicted RNase H-like HicB family nuclease
MMQTKLKILLSYSEELRQYVAEVPALPSCKGFGASYADALAAAEQAIEEHRKRIESTILADPLSHAEKEQPFFGGHARARQALERVYGKLTLKRLRELLAPDTCTLPQFVSALAGGGTRALRVRISIAADIAPSKLWPHRPYITRIRDDQEFHLEKRNQLKTRKLQRASQEINAENLTGHARSA